MSKKAKLSSEKANKVINFAVENSKAINAAEGEVKQLKHGDIVLKLPNFKEFVKSNPTLKGALRMLEGCFTKNGFEPSATFRIYPSGCIAIWARYADRKEIAPSVATGKSQADTRKPKKVSKPKNVTDIKAA